MKLIINYAMFKVKINDISCWHMIYYLLFSNKIVNAEIFVCANLRCVQSAR